jgi:hypothetical protein
MTTANIENEPVSIQLANSTTTVPSNEVWKVTIAGGSPYDSSGNEEPPEKCLINGIVVASGRHRNETYSAFATFPFDTVVVGNDVIEHTGNKGLQIGGFVVNDNYTP